jgi:hypothetical protein
MGVFDFDVASSSGWAGIILIISPHFQGWIGHESGLTYLISPFLIVV